MSNSEKEKKSHARFQQRNRYHLHAPDELDTISSCQDDGYRDIPLISFSTEDCKVSLTLSLVHQFKHAEFALPGTKQLTEKS